MRVRQLIEVLKLVDPELAVVTYANGHSYHSAWDNRSHGGLVVGIYHRGYRKESWKDDDSNPAAGIIIGNVHNELFNYPNDWMGQVLIKEKRV